MRSVIKFWMLFFLVYLTHGIIHAQKNSGKPASNKLSEILNKEDYLPKNIIIKFKPEFRNPLIIQEELNTIQTVSLKKKFPKNYPPETEYNTRAEKLIDLSLIYEITYESNIFLEDAIQRLISTGKLEYAEPHYLPKPLYSPDDPYTGLQYYLTNIKAFQGWDIEKGDSTIIIGISDTGFELTHSDLQNFVPGWDLGMDDADPSPESATQANNHGTRVAGVASGRPDNATGIAGVGFNCKFMPLKVADNSGSLVLTACYESITYAADNGCNVINCSWGLAGFSSAFEQDVINYATFNKNCLVVAAAGNNYNASVFYPASYDNVLSVAATNINDVRRVDSNYGVNIDISAPGDNMYTTNFSNTIYNEFGGTSYASPVVAACAGLVKAHFPTYSALQIAEQLRATADDINNIPGNASYKYKLGRGRVNLYRALTENPPAIKAEPIVITDNNDDKFVPYDTLRITATFKNYLASASNISVSISSLDPFIKIQNGTINIGNLASLQTTDNNSNPLSVIILPGVTPRVLLKLTYVSGIYEDWQMIEVELTDYMDLAINNISTTITSRAAIGYPFWGETVGLGFNYKTASLSSEMGFMIGESPGMLSDILRGDRFNPNRDFRVSSPLIKINPSAKADFEATVSYNDSASTSIMGLNIRDNTYAWADDSTKNFIIKEYIIRNNSATIYSNLFAGIFSDFDIMNYSINKTGYDTAFNFGYAYSNEPNTVYSGIKLLGNDTANLYSMDIIPGGAGGVDIVNNYTKAEKYTSLSTSRHIAGAGPGQDIAMVLSSGPHVLNPGDSVKIAFALMAGDSLQDLKEAAINAELKYNPPVIPPPPPPPSAVYSENVSLLRSFPNPAKNIFSLQLYLKNECTIAFSLQDIQGKVISDKNYKLNMGLQKININTSDLSPGIYFYHLKESSAFISGKLVITK